LVSIGNWPLPTPNPDPYGSPNIDFVGISWVVFDAKSGRPGAPTPRIFVAVANNPGNTIFVTEDAGNTCKLLIYTIYVEAYADLEQGLLLQDSQMRASSLIRASSPPRKMFFT